MFDLSSFANPTPLAHADASRDILPRGGTSQHHLLQRILTVMNLHGLLGNEVADDLAMAATSNPVDPETHMVLTSTEIYSRAKELICRTWVVPPVHPWYFQRHPGSAISFKGSRSYQTAFSRFSTGHLRCMNFEGGKRSFPICPKCNIS
ncbi:RNase H domain-containing protein [Trichonephila clavipes]|nr:RNase H domain-containing protein [Trichonephila clavipes]